MSDFANDAVIGSVHQPIGIDGGHDDSDPACTRTPQRRLTHGGAPQRRRYMAWAIGCAAIGSAAIGLTGCSSDKPFQPDLFSTAASPYSHNFNATHADACEAARRAMLSQGYTTTVSTADSVDADKGFQPSPETHISVSFHVVCTGGEGSSGTSVLYVNAVQDNYGLKKSDTSASVGLSILGSVSLPIRSNSDSMVKISSQTIPPGVFYDRFFSLVDHYLKTVVRSTPVSDNDVPAEPLPPLPSPLPPTPAAVPIATGAPAPVEIGAVPSSPDRIQKLAPLPKAPPPAAKPTPNTVTSMPILPAAAPATDAHSAATTGTPSSAASSTAASTPTSTSASASGVPAVAASPTAAASHAQTGSAAPASTTSAASATAPASATSTGSASAPAAAASAPSTMPAAATASPGSAASVASPASAATAASAATETATPASAASQSGK